MYGLNYQQSVYMLVMLICSDGAQFLSDNSRAYPRG